MNNSYITIIKEKRTVLSRKRVPLNQNECTANFRIGVPFEQNLQETLSTQRKIKKVESQLSLNTFVSRNTRCEYQEFLGSTDAVDENIVVEEFKSQLTSFEKLILNWRTRNIDLENNISIGYYFKERLLQSLENMKEKAYRYFGKDYVRSFFETRIA